MSEGSAPLHALDIDALPYRLLQKTCKEHGLSATGKTEELKTRLKQRRLEQQASRARDSSEQDAAASLRSAGTGLAQPQAAAATQLTLNKEGDAVARLTTANDLSDELVDSNRPIAKDTADSGDKQAEHLRGHPAKKRMLDVASLTPLPPQQQDAAAVSSGQSAGSLADDEGSDGDVQQIVQPTKLFEGDPGADLKQEKPFTHLRSRLRWLWPCLLALPLLSAACWWAWQTQLHQHPWSRRHCNQSMRFETLAPLLAHEDARTHLADVWNGEFTDPRKATGVLLACSDANTSSAAMLAVATSLDPSCGHCLHHFDMPALAAATAPGKSQDLAGQVQKALVQLLRRCSRAVVLIQGIESMHPGLLPVVINGLSEEGKYQDMGQDVPSLKALFIATIVMPTGDLQQAEEEIVSSKVKQHLVWKVASQAHSRVVATEANALRRRFEHTAVLS